MTIFLSTLNQLAFLFSFIVIGYVLSKSKILPDQSATVLSKLENTLFIPALVMKTFIENFTLERIVGASDLILISFVIAFITIPFAIITSKILTKNQYIQHIYTYGLSFSNFGFMGNAVVNSLFPDIFFEYLVFTLPLWILIYLWGVPRLLMIDTDKKVTLKDNLKSFINPMFIAMIIGMTIGLLGISLPVWMSSLISVSGDCMSPIAMLLTGIVVSSLSLRKTFSDLQLYVISMIRLVVMPLIFIVVAHYLVIDDTTFICALSSLAMPLGLNTVVIPSAYGKDTSVAAGMALISHLLSCITIPMIFMLI